VYAGFHDGREGSADVWVWASKDRGLTFKAPTKVNATTGQDRTSQYLPRLAVSPSGRLDVVYYDRRADPDKRDERGVAAVVVRPGHHLRSQVEDLRRCLRLPHRLRQLAGIAGPWQPTRTAVVRMRLNRRLDRHQGRDARLQQAGSGLRSGVLLRGLASVMLVEVV